MLLSMISAMAASRLYPMARVDSMSVEANGGRFLLFNHGHLTFSPLKPVHDIKLTNWTEAKISQIALYSKKPQETTKKAIGQKNPEIDHKYSGSLAPSQKIVIGLSEIVAGTHYFGFQITHKKF